MKIILAQFKRDIAANRWLFWTWVACGAAVAALGLARLAYHPGIESHQEPSAALVISVIGVMSGAMLLVLAQYVLMMALVVRVVQSDSVIDPNAFWRTRPIARAELLGEKTLFVALLSIGLVVSALAMGMRYNHRTVIEGAASPAVFLLGLFVFAAVTRDFLMLALTYLGFAIGSQIVVKIVKETIRAVFSGAPWMHAVTDPHVFTGIYLAGFSVAIAWQYLTLRTNVTWAILGVTFLAATALGA